MKKIILFIMYALFQLNSLAQVNEIVFNMYSLIKEKSVFNNTVKWTFVENNFKEKLQKSTNDVDSIKSLIYVFEQLGDVHSTITYKNNQYGNYPQFNDSILKKLVPLVNKSQEQNGIIKTNIFKNKYAYIQIPSVQAWGEMTNQYAQNISDSICKLYSKNIDGFIIDLRLNGGGQLSSMLSGLNMLLGNSYLGGGITNTEIETNKFEIIDENFCINKIPMTSIKNKCSYSLYNKPIVLIIGPVTRSSGTIVAIAFKQRKNTFFIGEPTANGYSTGNDYFYFSPTISMNLSTHFSHDRNKVIYKNSVSPDRLILGNNNFEYLMNDKKVLAAIDWLQKK